MALDLFCIHCLCLWTDRGLCELGVEAEASTETSILQQGLILEGVALDLGPSSPHTRVLTWAKPLLGSSAGAGIWPFSPPHLKWGAKGSAKPVSSVTLFPPSFLGFCPLLTSSSLPSGPWLPGNSPWGVGGGRGLSAALPALAAGLVGRLQGLGGSLRCSDFPPFGNKCLFLKAGPPDSSCSQGKLWSGGGQWRA